MSRAKVIVAASIAAIITTSPSAFAFGGPHPPQNAIDNCTANFEKQLAKGRGPGDGNKGAKDPALAGGFPSVTNCDHFWQSVGAIGPG